jgi:formylglycine-generating enzyme required for sulfatase activity
MVRVPRGSSSVPDFFIDRTEVTAGDYLECIRADECYSTSHYGMCEGDSAFRRDDNNLPINCVRPQDAVRYCRFRGKRVPTREEWLRAAQGDAGGGFPWGAAAPSCKLAVIDDAGAPGCGSHGTLPVGSRPAGASPYGALDMVGNVAEFVLDPDPINGDAYWVAMGGSYWTSPHKLQTVMKDVLTDPSLPPGIGPTFGFRCAWSPGDSTKIKAMPGT